LTFSEIGVIIIENKYAKAKTKNAGQMKLERVSGW